MHRNLPLVIAAALAATALTPVAASAQDVVGSGIDPVTVDNTVARPIAFAAAAPAGAALAVVMTSAELPSGLDLPGDTAAYIAAEEFTGKSGETLAIPAGPGRPSIMLFGAAEDDGGPDWSGIAGTISRSWRDEKGEIAIVGLPDAQAMADAALGAQLGQYRFDRYKSDRTAPPAQRLTIVGPAAQAAQSLWENRHRHLAEGVFLARDLVNEPANVIYPASFVERARAALRGVPGVTIEVLDEAALRRRGMGAIVGVGQGSPRGSRLMVMTYRGAEGAPIALAGKGITFDSGGISLKPGSGMWEMKGDMSGAAAVTGALLSLAKSRAPVHVVALAALAENMPGDNAQRPGDVVRTLSGKTIEIRSTDAEGRLVLADAIEYAVQEKRPYAVADIATLTGSQVAALGPEFAGLFAREDAYAQAALAAGEATGEVLWRLPLHPAYREAIKSPIADIKNSEASPAPGASAGAHFIEYFVPEDMPWVHIDMASVDRSEGDRPTVPAGARGFGVRLLDELARSWRPQ